MHLAELYSALADPTRLRVLEMLHDKPRPVHELAGAFEISRPAISRHLRVLKEAGLVQEVKQGRENLYSFQRAELKPGIAWLDQHQRKAQKGRKAAAGDAATVAAAAPAALEAPIIVAEPIVVPAPAVPEFTPEQILVAKPKAPAKARTTKPKVASEPVAAPPPPRQAPQLSFFDL